MPKRIFLYEGTTSFARPDDWTDSDVKIECIGAGGRGGNWPGTSLLGGGGGGGAYAYIDNPPSLAFPVSCNVGGPAVDGDTTFGSYVVAGRGGDGQDGGVPGPKLGGAGGTLTYPAGHPGGDGTTNFSFGAGGVGQAGGGAGGPNGPGSADDSGGSGHGGASDGGSVPRPTQYVWGAPGNSGTQWGTHGTGTGGNGGFGPPGGAGGAYGGGGGAAGGGTGREGGPGGAGLIIITYEPKPRTRVYLYAPALDTYVTSFPDPGNVRDDVLTKVECVGSGGWGSPATDVAVPGDPNGGGGGGGAYAYQSDLSPSFPVPCRVAFGVTGTIPNSTTFGAVAALSGKPAVWSVPGDGGDAGVPNGFAGGAGGTSSSGFGTVPPGGGGGAGGPNGAGSAGQGQLTAGPGPMAGGAADGGTVPGATAGGAAGASGTQWDNIHGVGSGGAGGVAAAPTGGAGGRFGGGGGGSRITTSSGQPGHGLIVITYTPIPPPPKTRVFLYANVISFPDPGNWDPDDNKVEVVGTGGSSGGQNSEYGSGGGGGGGGYAIDTNISPSFPVPCYLEFTSSGGAQRYTQFGSGSSFAVPPPSQPGLVWAQNGASPVGPPNQWAGGLGGNTFYPAGTTGGRGANTAAFSNTWGGAGGGGAGGPNGAGANGTNGAASWGFGVGGAGDGGLATVTPGAGGAGRANYLWDNIHGIGSGGSGATNTVLTGGAGGFFGGGGGGASGANGSVNGDGRGLIVLTWTPLPSPPKPPPYHGQTNIMM